MYTKRFLCSYLKISYKQLNRYIYTDINVLCEDELNYLYELLVEMRTNCALRKARKIKRLLEC